MQAEGLNGAILSIDNFEIKLNAERRQFSLRISHFTMVGAKEAGKHGTPRRAPPQPPIACRLAAMDAANSMSFHIL